MTPPERTPEQWAEDVASPYHGGLVEIDLGDCPFVYADREHGIALALRLLDLYGVPVRQEMLDADTLDPDDLIVPRGDFGAAKLTDVIPVSDTFRVRYSAEGEQD